MRSTAAAAAAAAALLTLVAGSPLKVRQSNSLLDCLSNANLAPIGPNSNDYQTDIAAYNQRLQPSPAAVVYPTTQADVATAIQCASSSSVPVSARGGGHSYASYGLGGEDGALVIDLSAFRNITVLADGSAVVGAGSRLGDIALALNDQGRGLAHGTCPYVGVGGHASFGGFGLASRRNGLLLDQITGYDVVLSNGTTLTSFTRPSDPDLYWALAGSAPSFGVITAFHFQTFPVPTQNINFAYAWNGLSSGTAASLFSSWQAYGAAHAPTDLGLIFTIGAGGSVSISGVFYGSEDGFHEAFDQLVDKFPEGYTTSVKQQTWIEVLQDYAGDQSLDTSSAKDYRDDFYTKSIMTPQGALITDDVLNTFFEYLFDTQTSTNWFVEVNLYGGNGSVINDVSLDDSSFGFRDRLLTFQLYASSSTYGPPYPDDGITYVQGMYDSIVSGMNSSWSGNEASYVNYVDPLLDNWQQLYWGNQYSRLSSLKARYDPNSVLHNPQSIVPASA
ncbi:Glucooligosaccharide oxidase [Meredithblackwellia eburnea MCA 4105]